MTWTHALCEICYETWYPGRVPARVKDSSETCCFCGICTRSGIFVRHDPKDPVLKCKGVHDDDEN